jgi:tetratricopeptide (TPR) repeat protein
VLAGSFGGGSLPSIASGTVNGILAVGPAATAALLFLLLRKRRGTGPEEKQIFLTVNAAAALLLIFSQTRLFENGLRWSYLLPAGPALYLYTASVLSRITDRARLRKAAVMLISAGIIHLVPILLVNSSPARTERRLLSLDAAPGEAAAIIAESAMEARDFGKSEKYYRIAADADSTRSENFYHLGWLNLRQEDYFQAAAYYGKALKLEPENPEYRFALAETYLEAEWYTDAVEQLEILTERFDENPRYWTRLGYAYNHSREYVPALRAYRNALKLEPGNPDYRENLYSAMMNRGSELQRRGRTEESERLYMKAISLVPYRWEGYYSLATLRMEEEDYEDAVRILTAAINKVSSNSYRVYLTLGVALEKLGRYSEALKNLRRAREMNPLSPAGQLIDEIIRKRERGG